MKINQEQLIELLENKSGLTGDTILEKLSLPITNNNRLCLSSILQKNKRVQLSYFQLSGHAIRVYQLNSNYTYETPKLPKYN